MFAWICFPRWFVGFSSEPPAGRTLDHVRAELRAEMQAHGRRIAMATTRGNAAIAEGRFTMEAAHKAVTVGGLHLRLRPFARRRLEGA